MPATGMQHDVAAQAFRRVQRVGPAAYAKETLKSFIQAHRGLARHASADIAQGWAKINTQIIPKYETGMYELASAAQQRTVEFVKTQAALCVPTVSEVPVATATPTEETTRFQPDVMVGCSCLLFALPSLVYAREGYTWGAMAFLAVTVSSVLADALFCRHQFFDVLDRIVATACFITAVLFNGSHPSNIEWFPYGLAVQALLMLLPLYCLHHARKHEVRSSAWRWIQSLWHVCGVAVIVITTDLQLSAVVIVRLWEQGKALIWERAQ